MPLGSLFGSSRANSARHARARHYVQTLMVEPPDDAVEALAVVGDGDRDHARWELRYARRTLGLLVAARDALDDRTASDVAAALEDAHRNDPNIAAGRIAVADRQFNERLAAYREAMAERGAELSTSERLGYVLLTFARATDRGGQHLSQAARVVGEMLGDCNASLREAYGEAQLPETVKPSEIAPDS